MEGLLHGRRATKRAKDHRLWWPEEGAPAKGETGVQGGLPPIGGAAAPLTSLGRRRGGRRTVLEWCGVPAWPDDDDGAWEASGSLREKEKGSGRRREGRGEKWFGPQIPKPVQHLIPTLNKNPTPKITPRNNTPIKITFY